MGSRNTDRVLRLRDLRIAAPGTLRIGVCKGCRHRSGLPLGVLIARFGEDHAAHLALFSLHCSGCGKAGQVEHALVRLCEPGCPKQRG